MYCHRIGVAKDNSPIFHMITLAQLIVPSDSSSLVTIILYITQIECYVLHQLPCGYIKT